MQVHRDKVIKALIQVNSILIIYDEGLADELVKRLERVRATLKEALNVQGTPESSGADGQNQ